MYFTSADGFPTVAHPKRARNEPMLCGFLRPGKMASSNQLQRKSCIDYIAIYSYLKLFVDEFCVGNKEGFYAYAYGLYGLKYTQTLSLSVKTTVSRDIYYIYFTQMIPVSSDIIACSCLFDTLLPTQL